MSTDTAAASPVEYCYLVTIMRADGTISTRDGIVTARPGIDTRQMLVNGSIAAAVQKMGLKPGDPFVTTNVYVERNDLTA